MLMVLVDAQSRDANINVKKIYIPEYPHFLQQQCSPSLFVSVLILGEIAVQFFYFK